MKFRHSRNSKIAGSKENRSWLQYLSISLLIGWLMFIFYCWYSGLFKASNAQIQSGSKTSEKPRPKGRSEPSKLIAQNMSETKITQKIQAQKFPSKTHVELVPHAMKTNPLRREIMHVVFSTDCNPFQDWQSLLLFHSASVVGQEGYITRIASGCNEEKKKFLKKLYSSLYSSFSVHFTPDFKKDETTKQSYAFYNKPRGLRHWLDNADPPIEENVVVALIDPDMIFLRPLDAQVRGAANLLHHKKLDPAEMIDRVVEGKPVGQLYGLGAPWTNDTHMKFNRRKICGEGSPCTKVLHKFSEQHFSVGPPYIFHRNDAEKIAETWTDFAPKVYNGGYPHLLAEMYAYSMAAAHENLPHLQLEQYMVSNVDSWGEGWPWVDAIENNCEPPVDGIFFPGRPLPTLLHYCQSYRVQHPTGMFGFGKRGAPENMFTCESPMFKEPPNDLDKSPVQRRKMRLETDIKDLRHNAFSVCVIHRALNAALIDFKQRICDPAKEFVNYNKTINIISY